MGMRKSALYLHEVRLQYATQRVYLLTDGKVTIETQHCLFRSATMSAATTPCATLSTTQHPTGQTMHDLSAFSKQFSELPVEIVLWIVSVAAERNIAHNATWVAFSLSVICRAFYDIVDPILVRTVRYNNRNHHRALINAKRTTTAARSGTVGASCFCSSACVGSCAATDCSRSVAIALSPGCLRA